MQAKLTEIKNQMQQEAELFQAKQLEEIENVKRSSMMQKGEAEEQLSQKEEELMKINKAHENAITVLKLQHDEAVNDLHKKITEKECTIEQLEKDLVDKE